MSAEPSSLTTERLLLRRWRREDREPFIALNADAQVMRHFPGCLSPIQSRDLIARFEAHFEQHGFGFWVVEVPGVTAFAGFTGLSVPRFESFFTPCVEIGWRLASAHWGRGYATEAARAALEFGFESVDLQEIVSFAPAANRPSLAVMERLGMTPAGDFEHPDIPPGHALRRLQLRRLRRDDWRARPVASQP